MSFLLSFYRHAYDFFIIFEGNIRLFPYIYAVNIIIRHVIITFFYVFVDLLLFLSKRSAESVASADLYSFP